MSDDLADFLKRGGTITKLPTVDVGRSQSIDKKFRKMDTTKQDGHAYRLNNYLKKSGGKLPRSDKMYFAFRKRMGVD